MNTPNPNIAVPASLMGEPTRAAILMLLCDGRAHAAGALADALRISAQSASNHLSRLVEGQLLVAVRQGRHKYFRLASQEVAHSIEALAALAPAIPFERLRGGRAGRDLLLARCCYRHLAGRLGVALLQALQRKGYLVRGRTNASGRTLFQLTPTGERWVASLTPPLPLPAGASGGEKFAQACMDWTERREHLAGSLANALLGWFEAQGYLLPEPRGRALRITRKGELYFQQEFGIAPAEDGEGPQGQPGAATWSQTR